MNYIHLSTCSRAILHPARKEIFKWRSKFREITKLQQEITFPLRTFPVHAPYTVIKPSYALFPTCLVDRYEYERLISVKVELNILR